MTDRVLTEEEVDIMRRYWSGEPCIGEPMPCVAALCDSHRLQAARIQELERDNKQMTDLLTPEENANWLSAIRTLGLNVSQTRLEHLCRDYLTLWTRHERLKSQRDVLADQMRKLEAEI